MKHLLLLLFVGFSLATARADEPVVQKNIAYLGADRSAPKADLYTPPGAHAAPLPAVLLIHGGGWVSGDKADARGVSVSTDLAGAGYVVFAINYHLGNANAKPAPILAWPQDLYDCKSALRYMRKQAAQLGIDPTRIAVMGESAGGHLSLLIGSTAHVDDLNKGGLYTDQSNEVSCIVDLYGVPDLAAFDQKRIVPLFKGATDAETAENIRRASPVTYIDAKTPPVLILHGTIDSLVPVATSRQLADHLKQLGVPCQYFEYPALNHGFSLQPVVRDPTAAPGEHKTIKMDLRPPVLAFLARYLGAPNAGPQ